MSGILAFVYRMFDLVFLPLRAMNPWAAVTILSIVTGVLMLLVFRYASNQKAIRRVKDRMQAHVLEVRLFQDQLGVVLRAYGRILRWTSAYLGHSLVPLAVMLVPVVLLLAQVDLRYGHAVLRPQQSFLLKVLGEQNVSLDQAAVRLPEGLAVTAPPLHILHDGNRQEVDWRIDAQREGVFAAEVSVGGRTFSKQVIVDDSGRASRVSLARVRSGWYEQLLESNETPLPGDAPVHHIVVTYPQRSLRLWHWELHWLVPFLALTLVAGFALKGVFHTEF